MSAQRDIGLQPFFVLSDDGLVLCGPRDVVPALARPGVSCLLVKCPLNRDTRCMSAERCECPAVSA